MELSCKKDLPTHGISTYKNRNATPDTGYVFTDNLADGQFYIESKHRSDSIWGTDYIANSFFLN